MRRLVLLFAAFLFSLPASAGPSPVTIGEVTSAVTREDSDLSALLRGAAEQELPGIELGSKPRPSILSFSLVRMDRAAVAENKTSVSCMVSATVRDKHKGVVLAVLEGRARAENEDRLVGLLERATLKSAVRGALARLPQALSAPR
jgi:hypothetical protein